MFFPDFLNKAKESADSINRFWEIVLNLPKPDWTSPHEDIFKNDFIIIKKFKKGSSGKVQLIIPPMAGHHSCIAQSVVNLYCEETEDSVYSIEWLPPNETTKYFGIEEVIDHLVLTIREISKEQMDSLGYVTPINLAGLCQGGWAASIFNARYPELVESMIIAGTPIDFKIDGGKIQNGLTFMTSWQIDSIIKRNNEMWPGDLQLLGFKMMNPVDRFVGVYCDLKKYILNNDEKMIKKWIRNNAWYEYTQNLPGNFIRQVSSWLFKRNYLIDKQLNYKNKIVDLKNINSPVVAITGSDDDVTLERQCTSIFDYISSRYTIHYHIDECGHIAIFLKKQALEKWKEGIKFIKENYTKI
jgi:poly(3-hydroxyalkanoate) synthetase